MTQKNRPRHNDPTMRFGLFEPVSNKGGFRINMSSASLTPASVQPSETSVSDLAGENNLDRARARFDRALARIETALEARAAQKAEAGEEMARKNAEISRLEAEAFALRETRDAVAGRLDATIGRLESVLGADTE